MKISRHSRLRRALLLAVALLLLSVAGSGCDKRDRIRTTTEGAVEATGTLQAQPSGEDLGTTPSSNAPWPRKLAEFAQDAGYPVWFPEYVPAGFEIETVDVIELDEGSGLVADILFLNGEKTLTLTQGSAVAREYEFESAGEVPWADTTAQVTLIDPADPNSPAVVVARTGDNLVELTGDIPVAELKKIAASMAAVK